MQAGHVSSYNQKKKKKKTEAPTISIPLMSPHLVGAQDFPQKPLQSPAQDGLRSAGRRLARSRSPPGPASRLAPPWVPGTSRRGWGEGAQRGFAGDPAESPLPHRRTRKTISIRFPCQSRTRSRATSHRSREKERAGARQPCARWSASPWDLDDRNPRPPARLARSRRGEDWALERGQQRRRAGHAVAAATDMARGRATCAAARPGPGSAAPRPRRTLPLAVPPLTPIRKGSPPLGCWWFCRVCSLSPAMAGAAPPPAAADGRTLPARARVGLPRSPQPPLGAARVPASHPELGRGAAFPGGAESLPLPAAAGSVYSPGGGQRDAAAPIRAGSALLFAEAEAARRPAPASAPPGPRRRRRPRSPGEV